MQDLISQPFRRRSISKGSQFETGIRALAPWQVRICNLEGCLAQTHLRGEPVRFNLNLSDPIEALLDEGVSSWRGVAGRYVVTLGPESHAEKGADPALPTLTAPVGAFTRVWLGVRPASGLAVTDDVTAPPDLLARLDEILCLPEPKADLDF
jgi:hypothetical protein